MRLALAAALLAGCGLQDVGGGAGIYLGTGEVFLCAVADSPSVELCWRDDDQTELARSVSDAEGGVLVSCAPTPRHLGPCLYSCDPGHVGCNAYGGCWCPTGGP